MKEDALDRPVVEKLKDNMKEKVKAHAKKMRTKADDTRTKCVDGGYRGDEAVGAIAIPGAHLGISMALLKLGFSAEESFELVYQFSSKDNNPYCWHDDEQHKHHDGVVVGCGHCNAAIVKDNYYGIDSSKVQALLEIVKKAQNERENMETVILDRDHAEQAILVITSTEYTVKPWDQEDDIQFFIYDKERHMKLLKNFADFLATQGKNVSFEDLVVACDEQTNSTLGLLDSSKGKQIFVVDVSQEEPIVEEAGIVPVIE